jgi:hypothetical protein
MGADPNRQVIRQDIDNLNFGRGLLLNREFLNENLLKDRSFPFKNDFKYGIWEEDFQYQNSGVEAVRKIGQKRSNANLVFLTHANLSEKYELIKNNKL